MAILSRLKRWAPLGIVIVFAAALFLLLRELESLQLADILAYLHQLPAWKLILAGVLVALNYLTLIGYDFLALRHLGKQVPRSRVFLASFAGYAIGNNVGHNLLAGGGVRYRIYGEGYLSLPEIVTLVMIGSLTFWCGLAGLAGVAFLVDPPLIDARFAPSPHVLRGIGAGLVALVAGYLAFGFFGKKMLTIRGYAIHIPERSMRWRQLALGMTDMALIAGILYALLPASGSLSYLQLISIYLAAQLMGILSAVPGGLGVFDTLMLIGLQSDYPKATVVGALLVYRALYYVIPLVAAALALLNHEIGRHGPRWASFGARWNLWVSPVLLRVLTVCVFLAGVALLFGGALPADSARMAQLHRLVPLSVIETSHFLASVLGTLLFFVAYGIMRRIDSAYYATLILLGAGVVLSLLRGLDYEEALLLGAVAVLLYPARSLFYRTTRLDREPISMRWFVAVAMAFLAVGWLGFFAYREVAYAHELWWQFELDASAPRFLRAGVGVAATLLLVGLTRLFNPSRLHTATATADELQAAMPILQSSANPEGNLVLLGDKSVLFDEDRTGFIMYAVQGRSFIAYGDPIGPAKTRKDLIWRFADRCDRVGGRLVLYQIGEESLGVCADLGMSFYKLGEEGRIDLASFSMEGGHRKGLRRTVRSLTEAGYGFRVVPAEEGARMVDELQRISSSWLASKHAREKGFSLGYFDAAYLRRFPIAVVERAGEVVAFANLLPSTEVLSVDLMRYSEAAPDGVMDFLFVQLILWAQTQHYSAFSLGMAPLSGLEVGPLAPVWNKVGTFVFRHGEHFYNFQGLRQYKDKFDPNWSTRYLALRRGIDLPIALMDVSTLISGGVRGMVGR
ncbi:MAG: bifunctional lysylphosphatidylglycerol flippase/synthetase MprF [Rhodothermales bacterium]